MRKKRPDDIIYSEPHLWIRTEDEETIVIGITDYPIKDWDEIAEIKLPKEGETLEQNSSFGEITSETGSIPLISPISGEIVEVNPAIKKNPNLILEDPYEDGWFLKIHLDDPSELGSLLSLDDYEEVIEEREDLSDEESDD